MKKFITFEGGEGSGKSTQTKLLSKSLNGIGEENIITREPGGTPFSEKIRNLIVNKNNYNLSVDTELLLVYASRHEHVKNKIIPSLKSKNVICDRYIHSSYCYQKESKNLNKKIDFIHKHFAENLMPDITFFLDLLPRDGIERSLKVKRRETKFEMKDLKFHENIRTTFLQLSRTDKKILKIDASLSVKDVHMKIIDFLNSKSTFKKKLSYAL